MTVKGCQLYLSVYFIQRCRIMWKNYISVKFMELKMMVIKRIKMTLNNYMIVNGQL